jgi:hypothetical protein
MIFFTLPAPDVIHLIFHLFIGPLSTSVLFYLCTSDECIGFVGKISKFTPPVSIGGQALFFPTPIGALKKPSREFFTVRGSQCFFTSFVRPVEPCIHLQRC